MIGSCASVTVTRSDDALRILRYFCASLIRRLLGQIADAALALQRVDGSDNSGTEFYLTFVGFMRKSELKQSYC